jgi:hypothetical protein
MTSHVRPMDRFVPRDDALVVLRQRSFMTSRIAKRVISRYAATPSLRLAPPPVIASEAWQSITSKERPIDRLVPRDDRAAS